MPRRISWLLLSTLTLLGCRIENYEDIEGDVERHEPCAAGASGDSGKSAAAGAGGASGAAGASAAGGFGGHIPADASMAGASGAADAGAIACEDLDEESSCSARSDCEPVYAGVDCSCGPDCTCIGGTPGCICESFEFHACEAASP